MLSRREDLREEWRSATIFPSGIKMLEL